MPTIATLRKLPVSRLRKYFSKQAKYHPDAPVGQGWQYTIRLGSRVLHDDDTADLFDKFIGLLTQGK